MSLGCISINTDRFLVLHEEVEKDADREEAMAETLSARPPIPGVRSPGVNNFRAGPGASQIASASNYGASGATERPRT